MVYICVWLLISRSFILTKMILIPLYTKRLDSTETFLLVTYLSITWKKMLAVLSVCNVFALVFTYYSYLSVCLLQYVLIYLHTSICSARWYYDIYILIHYLKWFFSTRCVCLTQNDHDMSRRLWSQNFSGFIEIIPRLMPKLFFTLLRSIKLI